MQCTRLDGNKLFLRDTIEQTNRDRIAVLLIITWDIVLQPGIEVFSLSYKHTINIVGNFTLSSTIYRKIFKLYQPFYRASCYWRYYTS